VWTKGKGTDKEKSISLLENVGANMVIRLGSGLPYSKQSNVTSGGPSTVMFGINQRNSLKGNVNGSHLPWQFRTDLRVDKNIPLMMGGKKEGEKAKYANLNVYLLVLNLFNSKNIQNIYRYTGNPDDDGYLAAAENQGMISSQNDPQSFRDLYTIKMDNPDHYSIPRRIRLGLTLDF
jgi:hypothetical protein